MGPKCPDSSAPVTEHQYNTSTSVPVPNHLQLGYILTCDLSKNEQSYAYTDAIGLHKDEQ